MYCPHCGVDNSDDTRYCRGCGEDLRLVAQAVTKSLPMVIAQRVDEAIDRGRGGWRSYQVFKAENRRTVAQALMAFAALVVVVSMLGLGYGSVSFAYGFLLVMTSALFISPLYELWTRSRQKRRAKQTPTLPGSSRTKELEEPRTPANTSVTDSTTRKLKI